MVSDFTQRNIEALAIALAALCPGHVLTVRCLVPLQMLCLCSESRPMIRLPQSALIPYPPFSLGRIESLKSFGHAHLCLKPFEIDNHNLFSLCLCLCHTSTIPAIIAQRPQD